MEPKLRAFLVSTQWGVKHGSVSIFVEYTAEMAVAAAVTAILRQPNPPTDNLTNLLVVEIEPAGLRTILTQLETGKPSGDVVKLVQPTEHLDRSSDPTDPTSPCAHSWKLCAVNWGDPQRWRCEKCGLFAGVEPDSTPVA